MDVLCFGSIVVDFRRPFGRRSPAVGEPLRIVENALDLRLGGVTILAATLRRMGLDVGLMGCVGRDIAGRGVVSYLRHELGVNVDAVTFTDAPTGGSVIRLTDRQRYVEHTPGANAELLGGRERIAFVRAHRPALVAIGYAGILPRLDADGGAAMAEWISAVQEAGALAALDTHTVPPYDMLRKPVALADVFLCNLEEAAGITGVATDDPASILAAIRATYPPADPARPRLFGLATPQGAQLAFGSGREVRSTWVANPYFGTFTPQDLTGAGDCFRAGVYAELLAGREAFSAGGLDLNRVALAGHRVASRCLQGLPPGEPAALDGS